MNSIIQEILHDIDERDVETQTKLGKQYYSGIGMPRNYNLAKKCFCAAANGGDAEAQYYFGKMYDERKVSEQNEKWCCQEAEKWYRKSAEQNFADAQLILGKMYSKGECKDEVKAYIWLALATAQGSEEARIKLDELESEMPEKLNEAQMAAACEWHEMHKNAAK